MSQELLMSQREMDRAADQRRRVLFVVCLIAAPFIGLVSDAFKVNYGTDHFVPMTLAKVGMLFYIGVAVGAMQMLRPVADRLGLTATCVAMAGIGSGLCITTARIYEDALRTGGDAAMNALFAERLTELDLYMQTVMIPIPGLAFPIAMILFGIAFFKVKSLPRFVPVLLVLAGILFPMGRIPRWLPAVWACDTLLLLAWGAVAFHVMGRETLLSEVPSQSGLIA